MGRSWRTVGKAEGPWGRQRDLGEGRGTVGKAEGPLEKLGCWANHM